MKRTSIFFFFLAGTVTVAAHGASTADDARQTIREWVQTQQLLSEEQTAWRQEKQVLDQSIDLLEKELGLLTTRIEELEAAGDETEERRGSLNEKNEALLSASAEAGALLAALEEEIRALRPAFPVPLERNAAPLFSRLEETTSGRSVAMGQRLQTILGILGEVSAFQNRVTLSRETREFGTGSRREVQTIYLGLGQAFFVDEQGRIAGTGRPTLDGWEWAREDELAPAVGRAVAILQNQRAAEFVNLPVEIAK